ncbi:radical SAM protein [Patulibacter sp. NPDC049589]|uniref:radical SAM protein n=1 Tax=Patulibacter sp. NPDC049589 TaxID=3154731 RepID=UPI0034361D64
MRWDHLTRDPDAETANLPGMTDPAIVRRFNAPEALDTRFYEIEAKTVLNKVPTKTDLPFGWTVNPYRGCSHACTYCLDPATPVLMADGRTTPIGDLEPGDAIYGTKRDGHDRRYVTTTVEDRWPTRKPAFAVRLDDGTELIASGDHRFLTSRGWKHVTGSQHGAARRPHLTVGTRLLGPGGAAEGPEHDDAYRREALRPLAAVGASGDRRSGAARDRSRTGGVDQDLVGVAVREDGLRVIAIEPLGVRDLVDITTGTGDFVAAGVISHNCFARPTHEYLGFNPGRDFEREIVVKVNAPERLRADLAKRARTPAYGDTVALGTNTDPYQWVESKYRLMPGIWEAIRDARVPGSVLTKSPLLLRDQALMLEVQATAGFEAALSVPSLDTKAWRTTEPHTPHPRARLAAVAELNRIGIPTAVLAAPIMPGINDSPAQIEALLAACTEAGAIGVRGIGLHLRGTTRDVFLEWLADARPDLVDLYAELYQDGPHLPRKEAARLAGLVQQGELWGARVVRTERPAGPSRFAPGSRALSGGPAEPPRQVAARRAGTRGTAPADADADQLSLF